MDLLTGDALKKIKLTFPYPEWPLDQQLPGRNPIWGPYQFYINPSADIDFDFWFVYNFPINGYESCSCRKGSVVLITGEPQTIETYSTAYAGQFDFVITSQIKLQHKNKIYSPQGLPWFVNRSFDDLIRTNEVQKSKSISLVTSNKTRTVGHEKRLEFAFKLKDYFGTELDIFGRGINNFIDKWDVIAPYKYSIAIENTSCKYYFSEKITDCYLALTFPIYYGCTNISDYFQSDGMLNINIGDFEGSLRSIESLLRDERHYARTLRILRNQKERVLNDYNLFAIMAQFANTIDNTNEPLCDLEIRYPNVANTLFSKLKKIIR